MTFNPLLKERHVIPRWRSLKTTVNSGELAMPRKATEAIARNPSEELVRRLEAFRLKPPLWRIFPKKQSDQLASCCYETLGRPPSSASKPVGCCGKWGTKANFPTNWSATEMTFTARLPYGGRPLVVTHMIPSRGWSSRWATLLLARTTLHYGPWPSLCSWRPTTATSFARPRDCFSIVVTLSRPTTCYGITPQRALTRGSWPARSLFRASRGAGRVSSKPVPPSSTRAAFGRFIFPSWLRRLALCLGGGLVDSHSLDRKADSTEARVLEAYWRVDFREIVDRCEPWSAEEPYSHRPAQFGSGAAITIEDLDEALRFCAEGLKKSPDNAVLKNNRAYALVATGQYLEGAHLVASCLATSQGDNRAAATATHGFLCMRTGALERGVNHYKEAIAFLRRSKNAVLESLARVYFAQEAARAGLPEAAQVLAEARDSCKPLPSLTEAPIILERAERWMQVVAHRKGQTSLVKAL